MLTTSRAAAPESQSMRVIYIPVRSASFVITTTFPATSSALSRGNRPPPFVVTVVVVTIATIVPHPLPTLPTDIVTWVVQYNTGLYLEKSALRRLRYEWRYSTV